MNIITLKEKKIKLQTQAINEDAESMTEAVVDICDYFLNKLLKLKSDVDRKDRIDDYMMKLQDETEKANNLRSELNKYRRFYKEKIELSQQIFQAADQHQNDIDKSYDKVRHDIGNVMQNVDNLVEEINEIKSLGKLNQKGKKTNKIPRVRAGSKIFINSNNLR